MILTLIKMFDVNACWQLVNMLHIKVIDIIIKDTLEVCNNPDGKCTVQDIMKCTQRFITAYKLYLQLFKHQLDKTTATHDYFAALYASKVQANPTPMDDNDEVIEVTADGTDVPVVLHPQPAQSADNDNVKQKPNLLEQVDGVKRLFISVITSNVCHFGVSQEEQENIKKQVVMMIQFMLR